MANSERERIKNELKAQMDAKLREFATAAFKQGFKANTKSEYTFTAQDNSNLNSHLDAVLTAFKSGEIDHGKAHGLLAHLVMLGVNGHAGAAARFVAISSDEHFRDN